MPRSFLTENGQAILKWIEAPNQLLNVEAGADTGIGWMVLQFYTMDRVGHARCSVKLASATRTDGPRSAETSRFSIALRANTSRQRNSGHITFSSELLITAALIRHTVDPDGAYQSIIGGIAIFLFTRTIIRRRRSRFSVSGPLENRAILPGNSFRPGRGSHVRS